MDTAELRKLLEENEKATLALVVCHVLLFVFILRSKFGLHTTENGRHECFVNQFMNR